MVTFANPEGVWLHLLILRERGDNLLICSYRESVVTHLSCLNSFIVEKRLEIKYPSGWYQHEDIPLLIAGDTAAVVDNGY